jgi:hypothetical protein
VPHIAAVVTLSATHGATSSLRMTLIASCGDEQCWHVRRQHSISALFIVRT